MNDLVIVDLETCSKLQNPKTPFILVLNCEDNLFQSLQTAAAKMNLQSASLNGLGALRDPKLAYYYLDKKEYKTELKPGMFELLAMNGNISFVDDKHFLHIHVALGEENYNVIGGHLMDAIVGASIEITVTPLNGKITREYSDKIGLKLLCSIK